MCVLALRPFQGGTALGSAHRPACCRRVVAGIRAVEKDEVGDQAIVVALPDELSSGFAVLGRSA